MEKAYDLGELVLRLKDRGLDVAEEGAVIIVEELTKWVSDSALVSANAIDDIIVPLMPHLEKMALAQVDKIDGEDDEGR